MGGDGREGQKSLVKNWLGAGKNGTGKGGDAGKERLFHALFHGKGRNVSERSLTRGGFQSSWRSPDSLFGKYEGHILCHGGW